MLRLPHLAFAIIVFPALAACGAIAKEATDGGESEESSSTPRPIDFNPPTTGFHALAPQDCAIDIAVGGIHRDWKGTGAWVLDCSPEPQGNVRHLKNEFGWQPLTGAAEDLRGTRIAVSPEGDPWMVATGGVPLKYIPSGLFTNIPRLDDSGHNPSPGPYICATSIGVGANDNAWIIGCNSAGAGGNEIYRLVGGSEQGKWVKVPGAAVDISVPPTGEPWIRNAQGTIFRWVTDHFVANARPGCATSLAVGDLRQYVTGCTMEPTDNFGVYQWMGDVTGWRAIPNAAAQKVTVDPNGIPWLLDADGSIYVGND